MIIDINAWTGPWNTLPIQGDVESVRSTLLQSGVDRICLAPLDAAWCPNQQQYNHLVYDAADRYEEIVPVPVIDPTLPTWQDALSEALRRPDVSMIKLLPAYAPYSLELADELCTELSKLQIVVLVQTRIDDSRHQHPLAIVCDIAISEIAELAERHPDLTVIAGGATTSAIRSETDRLRSQANFYADVSQADGMESLAMLVDSGLSEKLLFGTHAPLFVPLAGLARVIIDIDDEPAAAILGKNAARILNTVKE